MTEKNKAELYSTITGIGIMLVIIALGWAGLFFIIKALDWLITQII